MKRFVFQFLFLVLLSGSKAFAAGLKVILVSPELTGIHETGGLAHAVTGLAEGLQEEAYKAEVLMPFILGMKDPAVKSSARETGWKYNVGLDYRNGQAHKHSEFSALKAQGTTTPLTFLRHNASDEHNYFNNNREIPGVAKNPYGQEQFIGEAFGAFSKAAAEYILAHHYDIVILNDWTTGLIATHLAEAKAAGRRTPKVIFAVHNLAYQGLFPKALVDFLGLSESHYTSKGYEFYEKVSFLKAGLKYSDMIYTVSPQYASEIATPRFGSGLDGVIREKSIQYRMAGILNGIDNHEWDPSKAHEGLQFTFTEKDLNGKAKGKAFIQQNFGLQVNSEIPVFVLTSRMAEQKGFEYLLDSIEKAAQHLNAQWIVHGEGQSEYIGKMKEIANKYPNKVRYIEGKFSRLVEKQLIRYADFFVNGAWFEPCGLNQMFSLRTGTLPVVSAVGGLLNSVRHMQTGILFSIVPGQDGSAYDKVASKESAFQAFEKAVDLYKDKKKIQEMRYQAMKENNSWNNRVRVEFRQLFDYVINEGYNKMPLQSWKLMTLKTRAPICSKVH